MRWLLLTLSLSTCATPPPPPPPPKVDYREDLRRHGEWILVSPYGKLWHPNAQEVGKDFVPYLTGGSWEYSDRGFSFHGKWDWSDIVFHHGRWLWTQDFDWLWWLDEKEGVSFVDWRVGSEFIGWSPQPPPPPRANMQPPEQRWFYLKAKYFTQDELGRYVLVGEEAVKAQNLTEPVPAGPFNGPGVGFVTSQGGLVQEPDGGYRAPEVVSPPSPPAEPAVQQEAPRSNVEVEAGNKKDIKKTKGKKKKSKEK